MSMFRKAAPQRREFIGIDGGGITTGTLIPGRVNSTMRQGAVTVNQERSMRHSGVWAATRLRADLISTLPLDVYRDVSGLPTSMTKPPILISPGGTEWDMHHWMWASQHDLDQVGNAIGLITARNGIQTPYYPEGLPAEIQLQDPRACSVIVYKGETLYRIGGKTYAKRDVYHERQYPWSGTPVGLNPLIYAAASVGEFLSMQQYGLDWFAGGGVPKAWMRNTAKRLGDTDRDSAKSWYRDTIRNGDIMVTGADWEYNMIQAEHVGLEWLEGRRFGLLDIARFFSVPADLLDAAVQGQSVTYANITQRNLQFLIMNLGPAIIRRENYLTNLLPQPRYVKLNTDALLRMDPQTRQEMIRSQLETWQLTNEEARALDNRRPLTAAQIAQQEEIYGVPKMVTVRAAVAGGGGITTNPASSVPKPDPAPEKQGEIGAPDQPKQIEAAPAKQGS